MPGHDGGVGGGAPARLPGWHEPAATAERLVSWLREQAAQAGAVGAVVGLSGGIDSAVTAALCRRAFPGAVLGVVMPCHSDPQDAQDALLVARHFDIPVRTVVLDAAYDALMRAFGATEEGGPLSGTAAEASEPAVRLARANLKPRLRMATLYYFANLLRYLVVGTGNRSELYAGYFTKYGDGGVDVLPLGNLVKGEVRELARHLGVPEPIIVKPPSAGLWSGQTDEGEMGLTYEVLDRFILTGDAPPEARAHILAMHQQSAHKRALPPIPE